MSTALLASAKLFVGQIISTNCIAADLAVEGSLYPVVGGARDADIYIMVKCLSVCLYVCLSTKNCYRQC